jgi:glycosyltransferase involved in cell wall biosynthesis
VVKPTSPRTGIGRFALELARGLERAGLPVRRAELRTPIPRPLSGTARRLGYDLETFSRSYPLRADVRPGYLTLLASQTLATLLVTQRLPRPVVVVVHDILSYLLRDDPTLRTYHHRLDRTMDALAMRGLRRADRLVANSHYTKRTVAETLEVDPDRIDVVHHAVDNAWFRPLPVPDGFRARYGLPAGERYVLAVGSEDPRKNLSALLRAMAAVRQAVPNVRLLKVGAPAFAEQRRRHLDLCRELGLESVVRWLDEVPEEDLPLFYNAADVFAIPSLYEGFGSPALEALACGTPVVAARKASIPELVGEATVLVDEPTPELLASAITATLRAGRPDPEPLVRQAAWFTWDRTAEGMIAACERALQGRSGGLG